MTDHPDIVERLETEADLCRNEGAEDIARLLDSAASAIGMELESYGQLMAENTRLRAEAEALRKALQGLLYEDGGSLAMSKDNPLCVAARAAARRDQGAASMSKHTREAQEPESSYTFTTSQLAEYVRVHVAAALATQPAPQADTREALAALYEVVIARNCASAYWGEQFNALMTALSKASAALATQPAQPTVATVTECEACFTPDVCQLRGTCDHYSAQKLRVATQPAQPSAQGEAVAWLVEWKAHGYGPQWWGFNHTPGKSATWCSDANNAIRFARKEDAERMRLHIIAVAGLTGMHEYERSVSVTEHLWEGSCRAA